LKLEWTRLALADLIDAQTHIAADDPNAAQRIATRIAEAAKTLLDRPFSGRSSAIAAGTREWVISGTPYLLAYRVSSSTIEILRVWHVRRDRGAGA